VAADYNDSDQYEKTILGEAHRPKRGPQKRTKRPRRKETLRCRSIGSRRGSILLGSRFRHLGGRGALRCRRLSRSGRSGRPTAATTRGHDARLAASRCAAVLNRGPMATGSTSGQPVAQTQERATVAARPAVASVAAVATVRTLTQTEEAAAIAPVRHMRANARIDDATITAIATTKCQVVRRTRHGHHQHDTVHSTNLPQKWNGNTLMCHPIPPRHSPDSPRGFDGATYPCRLPQTMTWKHGSCIRCAENSKSG
jgi:hypothetical protein